jgi:RNA-dependent RNA polymerase
MNFGSMTRVITGPVVVAKNPCVHPGDVRVLMAVDEPACTTWPTALCFHKMGTGTV